MLEGLLPETKQGKPLGRMSFTGQVMLSAAASTSGLSVCGSSFPAGAKSGSCEINSPGLLAVYVQKLVRT